MTKAGFVFRNRFRFQVSRAIRLFPVLVFVALAQEDTAPKQPIAFSHRVHAAKARLGCEDCHRTPAKFGDTPGIPAASKCMVCHRTIAADRPEIRKLAAMAASNAAVPWVRVYKLPDFVFFDHRFHLLNDATCETCHGKVAERDALWNETQMTKMATCQGCHSKTDANNRCDACHNLRSIR